MFKFIKEMKENKRKKDLIEAYEILIKDAIDRKEYCEKCGMNHYNNEIIDGYTRRINELKRTCIKPFSLSDIAKQTSAIMQNYGSKLYFFERKVKLI